MKDQIDDSFLREVIKVAQQGAVSTTEITDLFIDRELFNKIYCGWGSGKQARLLTLSAEEIQKVSFALAAMANTLISCGRYLPKQQSK